MLKNKKYNILFRFIIVLLIFRSTLSCNSLTPKEKDVKNIIDTKLSVELYDSVRYGAMKLSFREFRSKYEFITVVFLKNGCQPCYSNYIDWCKKMPLINSVDNHTVLFIIVGRNYSLFMKNVMEIDSVESRYYTIMDPEAFFLSSNDVIPRWIIDNSITINRDNQIKMIGCPFASPQMTKLFYRICTQ